MTASYTTTRDTTTVYEIASLQPIWSGEFDAPDGTATLVQRIYEHYWQASVDLEAYRALRDHPERLDRHDIILVVESLWRSTPTKDNLLYKLTLLGRRTLPASSRELRDRLALRRKRHLSAAWTRIGG